WATLVRLDAADRHDRAADSWRQLFLRQVQRFAAPPDPGAERVQLTHARHHAEPLGDRMRGCARSWAMPGRAATAEMIFSAGQRVDWSGNCVANCITNRSPRASVLVCNRAAPREVPHKR